MTSKPNTSISKAARILGLKSSTAKLIVKRYKDEGTFFESKTSREKRIERLIAQQEQHI
jgi:transposase